MARREPSAALVATFIQILIWVWAEECLGVAPYPDTLQIPGIALGRKRREPECQAGEYPHPNGTHCCMRCHAGTYLAEHCQPGSLAPRCIKCPLDTFMEQDNTMRKCFSCQRCRSELKQITLFNCTNSKDTKCGCPDNQYQTTDSALFSCKNCSPCNNGTIRQKCTKNSDTVCICHYGFFLNKYNDCKPCSSCSEEECKDCGAIPGTVISSTVNDNSWGTQGLNLLLTGLVVVLATTLGVLFSVKYIKKYCQNGSSLIFYSCVSTQQPTKEPISEVSKVEINQQKSAILSPQPCQMEKMWAVTAAPSSVIAHELPDCVRTAGRTQLPENPAVLYTVVDHVLPSRWKEFVRRLGLSDYEIERIELEQRRVRDAQYEMLREWRLHMGQGATVERISYVLNQMELSGCSEAIQEALSRQS